MEFSDCASHTPDSVRALPSSASGGVASEIECHIATTLGNAEILHQLDRLIADMQALVANGAFLRAKFEPADFLAS